MLILAWASSDPRANDTVTLPLFMRVTSSGVPLGFNWKVIGCMATLAVKHFNERNSSVVPELAGVSRDLQLSAPVFDTQSVESGGIMNYRVARGTHSHLFYH